MAVTWDGYSESELFMNNNISNVIAQYIPGLLSRGKLHCCSLGFDECILSDGFPRFIVYRDREGVSVSYLKINRNKYNEYQIGHFLLLRRNVLPLGSSGYRTDGLQGMDLKCVEDLLWYEHALLSAGQDILSGDDRWLLDYPWNPIPVADLKVTLIERAMSNDKL